MKVRAFSAGALALLLASQVPVLAASTARTTITSFTYTLVDLTPDDAVEAAISFHGLVDRGDFAPLARSNLHLNDYRNTADYAIASEPLDVDYSRQHATGAGAVATELRLTGRGAIGNTSLTLAASADLPHPAPRSQDAHSFSQGYTDWTAFTLAANTAVVFSLSVDVALDTTLNGVGNRIDGASASAFFRAVTAEEDMRSGYSWSAGAYSDPRHDSLAEQVALQLTLTNRGAATDGAMLFAGTAGASSWTVRAIPEPATVLMLGTGLTLLTGLCWRRSRHARPDV